MLNLKTEIFKFLHFKTQKIIQILTFLTLNNLNKQNFDKLRPFNQ